MRLTETIDIGPVTLPLLLIIMILSLTAAYVAGASSLMKDRENRRVFSDLISSPLLPFLLTWKLSLLITDSRDVFRNPALLLYGSGGIVNILAGVLIGGIYLGIRWKRERPAPIVRRSLRRALITLGVAALSTLGYSILSGNSPSQRSILTPVVFHDEYGAARDISDDRGKVVVLNFWASWCPPCRAEMPMLAALQNDPEFSGIVFYAVNAVRSEKNPEAGIQWLKSSSLNLPLLFDTSGKGMLLYDITGLPTTLVIDSRGMLVERKTGTVSRSWISKAVRKAERTGRREN